MTVKLDDLELTTYIGDDSQGTLKQVRTITNLKVKYDRRLLNSRIASTEGSVLSDAGRHAMIILLSGTFVGEDAVQGLKFLEDKHRIGGPFQFVSDLTLLAQVKNVLIESLAISAMSGRKNFFLYEMVLREYNEPPAEEKAPSQDKDAKDEIDKEKEIDDIKGQVLDANGKPVPGTTVIVDGPNGQTKLKTDEEGFYELLDVPAGKYTVTVENRNDVKVEREIKKKSTD
jgi:hypothetical protein